MDITHNHGIGTDPNLIANGGKTLVATAILLPNGYTLSDVAISLDFHLWIDDQRSPMPEVEALVNLGFWVDLNALFYLIPAEEQSPKQAQKAPTLLTFTKNENEMQIGIDTLFEHLKSLKLLPTFAVEIFL